MDWISYSKIKDYWRRNFDDNWQQSPNIYHIGNFLFLSLFLLKLQIIFLAKSIYFDVPRKMFVKKAQVFLPFQFLLAVRDFLCLLRKTLKVQLVGRYVTVAVAWYILIVSVLCDAEICAPPTFVNLTTVYFMRHALAPRYFCQVTKLINQCCGSVTYCYRSGSASADPYYLRYWVITDPASDPALFFIGFRDVN
jgi:hypothetical protein